MDDSAQARDPRDAAEPAAEIDRSRDAATAQSEILEDPSDKPDIIARCAARGVRMTDQRRLVARVLEESDDHPDVEELHRRASAEDSKLSLATVYRTVRLFEEEGILDKREFGDGRARYEDAEREHHDHLIDMNSGEVIEFVDEEIERLQRKVAERLGYRLVAHRLELYCLPLSAADKAGGGAAAKQNAPADAPEETRDPAEKPGHETPNSVREETR